MLMCGKTTQNKLEMIILYSIVVAPTIKKMVENRLRWLVHIDRRHVDYVISRVDQMKRGQTTRGKGIPQKTISKTINKNLKIRIG